ncbi:hypothetical protein GOP47_0028421 [Adiantum capillus-veneris]|nr:hypothetical protein GOP47_0028421 [Adiantum capillus-veneris]
MGLERAKDPSAFLHLFHLCSVLFLSSECTLTCALWEQSQIESSRKICSGEQDSSKACSPNSVIVSNR